MIEKKLIRFFYNLIYFESRKMQGNVYSLSFIENILLSQYKAQNTYAQWTFGGPKGAMFTNTPSGWMEFLLKFETKMCQKMC
jgi:hypothetical protein